MPEKAKWQVGDIFWYWAADGPEWGTVTDVEERIVVAGGYYFPIAYIYKSREEVVEATAKKMEKILKKVYNLFELGEKEEAELVVRSCFEDVPFT